MPSLDLKDEFQFNSNTPGTPKYLKCLYNELYQFSKLNSYTPAMRILRKSTNVPFPDLQSMGLPLSSKSVT